jgi:hypothetical protein
MLPCSVLERRRTGSAGLTLQQGSLAMNGKLPAQSRLRAACTLMALAAPYVIPANLLGMQSSAATETAEVPAVVQESADTVYVTFETVEDIERFFEEVHYTPQTWAEGVRELPRMYLTAIGERWKQRTQNELTVQAKKRIFFRPTAGRATETPSSNRSSC